MGPAGEERGGGEGGVGCRPVSDDGLELSDVVAGSEEAEIGHHLAQFVHVQGRLAAVWARAAHGARRSCPPRNFNTRSWRGLYS